MNINKKLGLLAIPLLATGIMGVIAVNKTPSAHATPLTTASTQNTKQKADAPELNGKPESSKPESAKEADNVQVGPQDETGGPDLNQADGTTAN